MRATSIIAKQQQIIAKDLRKLDEMDIGEKLRAKLLELGPGMVDAFVRGNKNTQAKIRADLKAYDLAQEDTNKSLKKLASKGGEAAGAALTTGLATSISAHAGQVYSAVHALGIGMIAELRRTIESGSPSKAAMREGVNFVQGLIKGMEGELDPLVDAVRGVTDAISAAVGKGLSESDLELAEGLQNLITQQQHHYDQALQVAQRNLDKLKERIRSFTDAIRSGFTDAADLVSGLMGLMGELTVEGGPGFGGTDITAFLSEQLAANRAFAEALGQLSEAGLSPALLSELAGQGPEAMPLIQALLAGGEGLITQFNETQTAIARFADTTASALADAHFGEALAAAGARAERLAEQMANAIERIKGEVAALVEAVQADAVGNEIDEVLKALRRLAHNLGMEVPHAAAGGVVMSPTLLVAGEAGPEAIVPLGAGGQMGTSVTVNIYGDVTGEDVASKVEEALTRRLTRNGALFNGALRG